jgi:hypothetical protein
LGFQGPSCQLWTYDKGKVVDDEFQTEPETEESTPTANQVF